MEKSFKNVQTREIKHLYRVACQRVIEASNEIRSIIGATQNLNYEQAGSNAQGAQYTNDGKAFRLIDFTVDVARTVREVLTDDEFRFYEERMQDKDFEDELKVQSLDFMRMQERLGRAFKSRKLFPVSRYLMVVKR